MKALNLHNQRGSGAAGVAGLMLGFSVVYFISYFIINWIYDTKESRRFPPGGAKQELRVITQEEVMKRGIGHHVFRCYGIFSKKCRAVELYQPSV